MTLDKDALITAAYESWLFEQSGLTQHEWACRRLLEVMEMIQSTTQLAIYELQKQAYWNTVFNDGWKERHYKC
jgi:hypothetical protein